MFDLLEPLLSEFSGLDYGEIRFHERIQNSIAIRKGELETAKATNYSGVAIRVLYQGGWGFSSTNRIEPAELKRTAIDAIKAAKVSSLGKKSKAVKLAEANLAKGKFSPPINDPLTNHSFEEKLELVRKVEAKVRKASPIIQSASVVYNETLDKKFILTTDGARAEIDDAKPEFIIYAVASDGKDYVPAYEAIGTTGGWLDLFSKKSPETMIERVVQRAEKLLKAPYPQGERTTVILDPGIVGLIAHEAIGHTVEADFVLSGAITKDKLNQRVASELVTLFDSGPEPNAGGTLLVDDEGVRTEKTIIIENGILKSYLHNRETAAKMNAKPTGNARAYEYSDEPLIRMRNTGIKPGQANLAAMISEVKHGYLLKSAGGGQADANAEFMFKAQEAYRIENGKIGELLRDVTISGQAFDVLLSVDAVSKDFAWDMGYGHCGKMQPAKVDGGGPYLRCQAIIGGRQK
jgi:TldD protein|uniref:TldD/PmbA family protein n=1 Tax=candidate division WOR-3 bacterium TaxID=2052148 RepID=A0A7C6A8K2_UNCW3